MKLVVFTLSGRQYAIDVTDVREVIRTTEILPLPDVPAWVEGIINLRGQIIPILSLSRKLGLGQGDGQTLNRVIVAHRKNRCFGVLVETVVGVLTLARRDLTAPDEFIRHRGTIAAVAKVGEQMIPLLDLEHLLSDSEAMSLPAEDPRDLVAVGQDTDRPGGSAHLEPITDQGLSS